MLFCKHEEEAMCKKNLQVEIWRPNDLNCKISK